MNMLSGMKGEAERSTPIPMILHCPACRHQHIDKPDPATGWTDPPHKSHLCAACGTIWRPADVETRGVQAIRTSGENDTLRFAPHTCERGANFGEGCARCDEGFTA